MNGGSTGSRSLDDGVLGLASNNGAGLEALKALVRDCAAAGVRRRVLLLRTDLLPVRLTRPHHMRLIRAALDPLAMADRARVHDLPAGCMAVSWRGDAPVPLRQSQKALEHLLGDGFQLGKAALESLVRLFELPDDGAALLAAAGSSGVAEPAPRRAARPIHDMAPELVPLDAMGVSAMERQLAPADVA